MQSAPAVYRVGDAVIVKIPELPLEGVDPAYLYPDFDPAVGPEIAREFGAGSVDQQTGMLRQSIHTWLVRTPDRVILVDTATGNDKERLAMPVLHRLNEPFLERLKAAQVDPEDVDLVLFTHLHVDHVGWNTHKVGDQWIPTFPNARYVFSARGHDYLAALSAGDGSDAAIRAEAGLGHMVKTPLAGVYEDSVRPVVEAGLARQIMVDELEAVEGFSFLPTPGHSIDHACIRFTSQGEQALFWGDVLHHPTQIVRPDWNSLYCEFPEAARASRRWALNHAAETGTLVFTSHFGESSAGRVGRDGDRFTWAFA